MIKVSDKMLYVRGFVCKSLEFTNFLKVDLKNVQNPVLSRGRAPHFLLSSHFIHTVEAKHCRTEMMTIILIVLK